jgi:hypothetical protein
MNMMEPSARGLFEQWLRSRRIPFVDVDETKFALMPARRGKDKPDGESYGSFHYVVYAPDRNLLVYVIHPVRRRHVETMRRWQELFGPEFTAVFVRMVGDMPMIRPIDDPWGRVDIDWPEPQRMGPSAHAPTAVPSPGLVQSAPFADSLFGGGA